MATVTPDDLAALLGVEFDDAQDSQAQAALDMALAVVGSYLPDLSFEAGEEVSVDLQGTWSRDLHLPKRPVTDVHSVSINGTSLDDESGWTWLGRNVVRRGSSEVATLEVDAQGADPLPVGNWGGPSATVTVVYSYDATFPADVRAVVLQVAKRLYTNPAGVRMEMLGGYQVQYDATDGTVGLQPYEAMMLRTYRRRAW